MAKQISRWWRPARADDPDSVLMRSAARRVGLQLAAVVALVVIVVTAIALSFSRIGRGARPGRDGTMGDILFDDGLFWAGIIGVLIAGVVGWFAASRAVKPLGEALSLQRRFVADAGHELRTPLTVLHTRAQLLSRKIAPDHPARALTDQLLADSRAMADIVDDLLTSAQLGVDPKSAELVDVSAVAGEVGASMRVLADQVGVTVRTDVQAQIAVWGARASLRRAILALVDNAIAHTPAGGTVWIGCRTVDGRVELTVADNGEGLDPADVDRLLERFARGSGVGGESATGLGTARRFGLGLALVRQIVDAHGGRLIIEGAPGVGARATIRLPVIRPV